MIVLVVFVAVLLVYYILQFSCNEKCIDLNKKNIFFSMRMDSMKLHFVPVRVLKSDHSRISPPRNSRTLKSEYCRNSSFPNVGYGNGKSSI